MKAWNKMSLEEARLKALAYNSDLIILDIKREGIKNEIRFEVLCPICGKERENSVSLTSIKNNKLSCKTCKHTKIGKISSIPKEGKSLYENDYYNRVPYWDFEKNNIHPKEVSKYSGIKCWFTCEKGHNFDMVIGDINHGKWCPHCANLLKESKMASTLKQVLRMEFSSTIWEHDIGFRGERGGHSSYDIYIPELNILIECQSEYHDCEEQNNLDIKKEQFAIDNGYEYLAIDYRSFEPLMAIQLFFPNLKQVPNYVDYTKNTRVDWDINEAQFLLDNTDLNQKEIANKINADIGSFYDKIHRDILKLPVEKSMKIPVVQLALNGEFISKYDYARECELIYGYHVGNICSCCKGNQNTYKGFLWMYESDYNNKKDEYGNIRMSENEVNEIEKWLCKEVIQLALDGEYIKEFKTIAEVINTTSFKFSNISACCNNKVKTSNGYMWMFKKDYDKIKDKTANIVKEVKFNEYRIKKCS